MSSNSFNTKRFAVAVISATVCFYVGPLLTRGLELSAALELTLLVSLAVVGAIVPGLILARTPELRRVMPRRIVWGIAILVGAAVTRWALVEHGVWSNQARSALIFLALLAVGLVYIYPPKNQETDAETQG